MVKKEIMVYICSTLFVGIILLYSGDDAATDSKGLGEVLSRNVYRKRVEIFIIDQRIPGNGRLMTYERDQKER